MYEEYFWNSPLGILNETFVLTLLSSIVNIQLQFDFHTPFNRLGLTIGIIGLIVCISSLIFLPILYWKKFHLRAATGEETQEEADQDEENMERFGEMLNDLDV